MCIKLVIKTSLYYDARSEKHQITNYCCIVSYEFNKSQLPQILNERLNVAFSVWMKDKLTCWLQCNKHADQEQYDKQDSESPHCSSRWILPQVMLQMMELVLMTALLCETLVARNRFMVTQLPPISYDTFPPCPQESRQFASWWRPTGNGWTHLLNIEVRLVLVEDPGGEGGRESRLCYPWVEQS
jgi:hypothetical protein